MKYLFSAVTIFAILSLYACRSSNCSDDGDGLSKLDAQSQMELTRAEQANSDDMLSVVLLFEVDPNEKMLDELKEMKVKIITKVGKILTAQANIESIKKIIKCNKVKQVEINKTSSTK